jgi:hypothetical protein
VTISLSSKALGSDPATIKEGKLQLGDGNLRAIAIDHGAAILTLPARSLAVLTIPHISLNVPAQTIASNQQPAAGDAIVTAKDGLAETRAAAIQVNRGSWDAYVWSTASPKQARSAMISYLIGNEPHTQNCPQYPFVFSIPMADEKAELRFHIDLTRPDGTVVDGQEGRLSLNR